MTSSFKTKWTQIIVGAVLLLSHSVFAQSIIQDRFGSIAGYTYNDVIENAFGEVIGYVENYDRISDKYGATVGYIAGDVVQSKYGDTEGYIVNDRIENRYGETIGYCQADCRSAQVGAASCLLLLSNQ